MPTATYQLIRTAILEKKHVKAIYNKKLRLMCPHVLGYKGAREMGFFFQYGGQSSTGLALDPSDNWRCLFIDQLTGVELLDEGDWHTANNHSQRQNCVDNVDVQYWPSTPIPS